MPVFDDDDKIAARGITAAILDICFQVAILAFYLLLQQHNLDNFLLDGIFFSCPLIYLAVAMWISSSPAQWMLGLVVLDVSGQRLRWDTRLLRAAVLKSPYILLMALLIAELLLTENVMKHIAGGFFAVIISILMTFFAAEQAIELCKPPYYDRWFNTRVIHRTKATQRQRHGFPVIMQDTTREP